MVGYCRLACIGLCEPQSIVILFSLSPFSYWMSSYISMASAIFLGVGLGVGVGVGVGIISKATSSGYNFMLRSKHGFHVSSRKHLSKPDFLRNTLVYLKHCHFPSQSTMQSINSTYTHLTPFLFLPIFPHLNHHKVLVD